MFFWGEDREVEGKGGNGEEGEGRWRLGDGEEGVIWVCEDETDFVEQDDDSRKEFDADPGHERIKVRYSRQFVEAKTV